MVAPERAVAVVVCDREVLVVGRLRNGSTYAVLPGGGVESGETAEEAALRELEEETSLVGRVAELLWVRDDGGRRATYFRITDVAGTPVLGGPERRRSSPDNQYLPRWVGAGELREVGLRPRALTPLVLDLLG